MVHIKLSTRLLAHLGWVPAQIAVAHAYSLTEDRDELGDAIRWCARAKESGSGPAATFLGTLYVRRNLPGDRENALTSFKFAAARGEAHGIQCVGWCHEQGVGTSKDPMKSVEWYKAAAEMRRAKFQTPKAANAWERHVRVLDHVEMAGLSKSALQFRQLMSNYKVDAVTDPVTAEALDVVFAKWLEDSSAQRMPRPELISVLGITFGNYLCDGCSMQWVEVIDGDGTTYAVLHESAEVYCFPLEAVRKRVAMREIGFFAGIETSVRAQIADPTTKRRSR